LLVFFLRGRKVEKLTSMPTTEEKKRYAREIIENKSLFSHQKGSLEKAKAKMPWMDPVLFENVRKNGEFTTEALENLF
jgi:hypothetical protein